MRLSFLTAGRFAIASPDDLFVNESVFNYFKEEYNKPSVSYIRPFVSNLLDARKFTEKDRCPVCVESYENVRQYVWPLNDLIQ